MAKVAEGAKMLDEEGKDADDSLLEWSLSVEGELEVIATHWSDEIDHERLETENEEDFEKSIAESDLVKSYANIFATDDIDAFFFTQVSKL